MPLGNISSGILEGITTYESFLSHESIIAIENIASTTVPTGLYYIATSEDDNKASVNGTEKAEVTSLTDKQKAEVINILKEAVKVDSTVTIDLDTDNAVTQ